MTKVRGFIAGYMSKEADKVQPLITDPEAFKRQWESLKSSPTWRLSGAAPTAGTLVGGILGGYIGEHTAARREYNERIKRALWGAVLGSTVGGAAGAFSRVYVRSPLVNKILGMQGSHNHHEDE